MELNTIAILSPGDMGHGVGKVLVEHGYRVITCLAGRSQRTRDLAAKAGLPRRFIAGRDDPAGRPGHVHPGACRGGRTWRETVADAMRAAGSTATVRGLQRRISPIGVRDSLHNQRGGWRLHRRRNHRRIPSRGSRSPDLHVGPTRRAHGRARRQRHCRQEPRALYRQGVGDEDVLCVHDEGDECAPGGDADSRGVAGAVRRAHQRARVQPGRGALRHGVGNTRTARQRRAVDRGDGGDRGDLRIGWGDTPVPPGRGGDIQASGLHAVRGREPGDHRPQQDPQGYD